MQLKDMLAKIAKGEQLTDEEKAFAGEFDLQRELDAAASSARKKAEADAKAAKEALAKLQGDFDDFKAANDPAKGQTEIQRLTGRLEKLEAARKAAEDKASALERTARVRQMAKDAGVTAAKEEPVFTDAAGRRWDAGAYLQMNVRTNAMRVYNDCLADDVARATGSDLMRISRGGDPNCAACSPWEGAIVSLTGKTEGLPTYEQAREAGCFHPNCVHTLECVDETADADEIALQRKFPVTKETAADGDAADERKYEIDQQRYRDGGMGADEAREAVDRDNLTASIRHGLLRADARKLVDAMTPAQVAAMCPNGNPPRFEPFKPTKKELREGAKETWRRGRRGGVVHVAKDATVERLLEVCGIGAEEKAGWRPSTALEKATDALMAEIGAKHVDGELGTTWRDVNPGYEPGSLTSVNCQRCAPTLEARFRGYDVVALPAAPEGSFDDIYWDDSAEQQLWGAERLFPAYKDPVSIPYKSKADIEKQMAEWGDGARAEIGIAWKGRRGGSHAFYAVQRDGKTIFMDAQGYEGSPDEPRNAAEFFKRMKKGDYFNTFCRVDNLEFSDRAKLAFAVAVGG